MSIENASRSQSLPDTAEQRPLVLVVGAGVIGVTAAHALLERGYAVTIVARESAHTITSTQFASPWAGAVWFPFSDTLQPRQSDWERATFEKWCSIKGIKSKATDGSNDVPLKSSSAISDDILALVPFKRIEKASDEKTSAASFPDPWWSDVVLDYKNDNGSLQCSTFTLDAPAYLAEMFKDLEKYPHFSLVKAEVTSLVGACAFLGSATACVVNATGLGARTLTDVQDMDVEPIGGQLVRLQAVGAPAVTPSVIFVDDDDDDSQDQSGAKDMPSTAAENNDESGASSVKTIERLYMIPRALSGDIVLGGTEQYGSNDVTPSAQQTKRIISRMHKHCPWLHIDVPEGIAGASTDARVPAKATATSVAHQPLSDSTSATDATGLGRQSSGNSYRVTSVSVGLRPGRKSGPRLELDTRSITTSLIAEYESSQDSSLSASSSRSSIQDHGAAGSSTKPCAQHHGKDKIPIVHAYGFGKTGFQVSWGVAHEIADLVESQLGPVAKKV